jgi:hypothetical protein
MGDIVGEAVAVSAAERLAMMSLVARGLPSARPDTSPRLDLDTIIWCARYSVSASLCS